MWQGTYEASVCTHKLQIYMLRLLLQNTVISPKITEYIFAVCACSKRRVLTSLRDLVIVH